MNKFAVLALFAVVGCQLVRCGTLNGFDEEEEDFAEAAAANEGTEAYLMEGNERLFTRFCHEQRDYLVNSLKNDARQGSALLFRQFFSAYNEVADDILNVEKSAVEELAKQIENPELPIKEGPLPEDQVKQLIDQGKREIASKAGPSYGLFPGAKAALSAVISTVNSALFTRLAHARSYLSANTLINTIHYNCDKVNQFEQHIRGEFEEERSSIAKSNADPEIEKFLQKINIVTLHCQPTKSIVRINAFCEIFKAGRVPFLKMLGLGSLA